MKKIVLFTFVILSLTQVTAQAEIKQGEHVIYSVSSGSSVMRTTSRIGTVVLKKGQSMIVQELNHPSKYGMVVFAAGETDSMVKTYGLKQVNSSDVVNEVPFTTRADGTIVKPGSQIHYRYGRGSKVAQVGRVLYTFENGRVAVISEEAYSKYLANGGAEGGGDRLFQQEVIAVHIR